MMTPFGTMTSWLLRISIFLLLLTPAVTWAEGYVKLVGLPGIPAATDISLGEYINALYKLSIGIAAVAAVLRIVLAGGKYIFSDLFTKKEDAKNDIRNIVIGLLVVLGAVLLLNTINPNLSEMNVLGNLKPSITELHEVRVDTACDPDTDAVCCSTQGGTFSLMSSSTRCRFNVTKPIVDTGGLTGNDTYDQAVCEATGNGEWDNEAKVCRPKNTEFRDIPEYWYFNDEEYLTNPIYREGMDRICEMNIASGWYYDSDTKKCRRDGVNN